MIRSVYPELARIVIAILIAFVAIVFTAGQRIDLENLAKGEENTSRMEQENGRPYTACTVKDIKEILDACNSEKNKEGCNSPCRMLWLGNSQLHYINQYKEGNHLAPYWLKSLWNNPECIEPLGCSLPNADFQEYLILSRYAALRMPIQLLIMELVFDDLREDALRDDFNEILSSRAGAEIRQTSPTAEAIVGRFLLRNKEAGGGEQGALSGTIQESVEKWLNGTLSASWGLWASRPQIEGNVYLGLYNLRNYLLGIKPTTVRKMIRTRYDLNMQALQDILQDCWQRRIPVLLYIAPIRQDKPIPYDRKEYAEWKQEVTAVARGFGARLVNLEQLIPGDMWGSYTVDDVDFMHFQGPGHQMVAEALLPHVLAIVGRKN